MKLWRLLLEAVSLQSVRGRLIFAGFAHCALLLVPYSWLTNLSLYKLVGLTEAPSIGLTRAYWHLLHGNLTGAWERNWLIFPVIAIGWSIVTLDIYTLLRTRKGVAPQENLPDK